MAVDTQYGFSAKQVIDRVENYIGNCSEEFTQFVQDTINFAQFEYAERHDWSFLFKTGLELDIVNGTTQYELNIANIGYNMPASSVKSIYYPEPGRILRKVEPQVIRRIDPEGDDGNNKDEPSHWAEVGEQRIEIYPPRFEDATVKIDGQVLPTPVENFTSTDLIEHPDARLAIPYQYQKAFLELVLAMVLDRENDDRADGKMALAEAMIQRDIQHDMKRLADTVDPRFRHWREANQEGNPRALNSIAFAHLDHDDW